MRAINISVVVSYIYLIIFFSLSLVMYSGFKIDAKKEIYREKIRYACSASTMKKFDFNDDYSHSILSLGECRLNYEAMYNEFIRVLKLNFKDTKNIESYLDKYIVATDNGIYINYKNQNDIRCWSLLIPYTISYNDNIYTFKLSDDDLIINDINIKRLAIVSTIRRNLVIENDTSSYLKIPFDDNSIYNSVLNQSVIATFTNCPIIGNKKVNIVSYGGGEVKEKNVYYINKNNRYEKTSYKYLSRDDIIFESKKEAGKYYYPELY